MRQNASRLDEWVSWKLDHLVYGLYSNLWCTSPNMSLACNRPVSAHGRIPAKHTDGRYYRRHNLARLPSICFRND